MTPTLDWLYIVLPVLYICAINNHATKGASLKQIVLSPWMAFLVILPITGLRAQEIPTYPTLPCQAACPSYVPSKIINWPHPVFTATRGTVYRESVVDVSFTVGTDGHAKNPIVERVIGSKNNVDSALTALANSLHKPATENGVPVEENRRMMFIYQVSGNDGARGQIASIYRSAVANSDRSAAIASLRALSALSDLNLYEATMIASALATLESDTGDYDSALRDVRIATVGKSRFLDRQESLNVMRLEIQLEAHEGQFAGAFSDFDELKKKSEVSDSDPIAQLVSQLHEKVASPQPLWADAKIPSDEISSVWNHTMLRRSFGFADIKGSLTKFHLRCETHGIESPVTDSATWTIPSTWTKCNIYVEGTPGTTFKFGEAQPDAASAPAKHS